MLTSSSPVSRLAVDAAQPARPVLELRQVRRGFGPTLAVDDVSLSVLPGEVFTLLGPSGCGKSTTLRIVAGLEEPERGEVYLDGHPCGSLPPEQRQLGMVFQSYAIWPHMTVCDNVAFPLQLRGLPKRAIHERVERVLELVGLSGLGERGATELSGGQQQRVALARAIVYEPKLLLLDEPLSNLDAKLREHMRGELRALQRRLGIAVLFVTHDQAEAMVLSDRIGVMQAGRIEQIDTPRQLYERPATPFVRDFLGRVVTFEISADSRERGLAAVPGEPGALLELPASVDVSAGRVLLACRPEDVRLGPSSTGDDAAGLNRLGGTIESVAFLGDRIEYGVRTTGGRLLVLVASRHERYAPGAAVSVWLDAGQATFWTI